MENKQKAIEKAYGEHWEAVKDYVDENGWIKDTNRDRFSNLEFHKTKDLMRPLSLQGIETNNGWIDFSVLPNDDKIYYFTAKNNFIFNVPQNLRMVIEKYINKEITHYYPIEQPKQKIY